MSQNMFNQHAINCRALLTDKLVHSVQSYSRDKTDWTVQSRKLSYRGENSADTGLQFPLYQQK